MASCGKGKLDVLKPKFKLVEFSETSLINSMDAFDSGMAFESFLVFLRVGFHFDAHRFEFFQLDFVLNVL